MDGTAIKQITDNAAAIELAQRVNETFSPVAAMPEHFKVVDLEQYEEFRTGFRARFVTHLIHSFVRYHGNPTATISPVFVDPERATAKVIFDLGSSSEPGHCRNTAELALKKTAAFVAFESLFSRSDIDQRKLAEWLEDWREYISAVGSDGSYIDVKQTINTVRKVTIEGVRKSDSSEENFSSSRSTLESITARSEAGELPSVLIFRAEPFHGLSTRDFRFRISIRTGGEKVSFGAFRIQEGVDSEEIGNDFCEILKEKLPPETNIVIGTIDTK